MYMQKTHLIRLYKSNFLLNKELSYFENNAGPDQLLSEKADQDQQFVAIWVSTRETPVFRGL